MSIFSREIEAVLSDENWLSRFSAQDKNLVIQFFSDLFTHIPTAGNYDAEISERVRKLREIVLEEDDSPHKAQSQKDRIVFFKKLNMPDYKYTLYHELFHFIQKLGSSFELVPNCVTAYLEARYDDDVPKVEPLLFEEAYVQYMASLLCDFSNEKTCVDDTGRVHTYWLNESYKDIVGYMSEVAKVVGNDLMLGMFLDDGIYERIPTMFDANDVEGGRSFEEIYVDICKVPSEKISR